MPASIRGAIAPIRDVAKHGYAAVAVYSLLFESAERDCTFHKPRNSAPYITGGTTSWTHKAISDTLSMGKAKVIQATDALLDHGFIQVVAREKSATGSKHRVYRVIHPDQLEAQRHALSLFDQPSSIRNKRIDSIKKPKPNVKPIEEYL